MSRLHPCGAAALLSAIVTVGAPAFARQPIEFLSFSELAQRSTLIVAGVVEETHQSARVSLSVGAKPSPAWRVISTLVVNAVLKGDAVPSQIAFETVQFDDPTILRDAPVRGAYRVYFLTQSQGTAYVPVNPDQLSMPAATFQGTIARDVSERIADVVGAVLSQPGASQATRREAIDALGYSHESHAASALRGALDDSDPSIRNRATEMLLRLGDETALPAAEAVLEHSQVGSDADVRSLRVALRALDQEKMTPAVISSLKRLTQSRDVETRRAAVDALSRSGSFAAVPTLATALVDGDRQEQLSAVQGLQKITGQHPPDEALRAKDGGAALAAFWISWARTRGFIK